MIEKNFIGVDGCKTGWFFVKLNITGSYQVGITSTFKQLWEKFQSAELILTDIPIGLRDFGEQERQCDKAARKILGKRGSSVFPSPCRPALTAENYHTANKINRKNTGRGLSQQTWNISKKIFEVDQLLQKTPTARKNVREIHPEILFWAFNRETPMINNKKNLPGYRERLAVMKKVYANSEAIINTAMSHYLRKEVARDDIVDALAASITGLLGSNQLKTIPNPPEKDPKNISMEMVYYLP